MDKTILVEHDLKEGERLLRALDGAEMPVVGAMWFYLPEAAEWRYFVASPLVDKEGPKETYARIENVRAATSPPIDISLVNVSAVSPDRPNITQLRLFAGTPSRPYVGGVGMSKSAVGDTYVDDAYIYRMERILVASGTTDILFAVRSAEKHKWKTRQGRITTKDGFIVKVEVENHNLRQSASKNGVKATFYVFQNATVTVGKAVGDVYRWRVFDGRLRAVEKVATEAEIAE